MTAWLTLFFASALLLPPLPIALGDSGPHLCLLFAAVGLLLGVMSLSALAHPAMRPERRLHRVIRRALCQRCDGALHSGGAVAAASFARVALLGISVYIFFYTAYGPVAAARRSARHRAESILFAALSALFACVDFYYQFPAPPDSSRNSSGSIAESFAALKACSTKPARSATSARSSW